MCRYRSNEGVYIRDGRSKYIDVDSMLNAVYLILERQCPSDRFLYTKLCVLSCPKGRNEG
jgi:hypothetical protein